MRIAIVLTFDIPDPETVPSIIEAIDPPNLPHFDGNARIVVEPEVDELVGWLDAPSDGS